MKREYVSWKEVEEFILELSAAIKKKGHLPTGVYGVPRGGLCIATLLSYELDIPLLMAPAKGCIIVDDIADSGRTLLHYTQNDTQFNDYYIATMYYCDRSIVKPDFFLHLKRNEWVVFPWGRD